MKKILLIEDNIELSENICSILEKEKYLQYSASGGETALKMIPVVKPDLILCDIMLPDMNGYSIFKKIKKMEKIVSPIFIFLTAKSMREDVRLGMELGAEDYITKPFTKEELLNSIKVQFEKREKLVKKIIDEKDIGEDKEISFNGTDADKKREEYLFLKNKKESGFYLIDEIIAISSLKDYSKIYLQNNKTFILRRTMNTWETRLNSKIFLRIHKQTIINLKFIEAIEAKSSNRYQVSLSTINKKFDVSQRYSKKIKHLFV